MACSDARWWISESKGAAGTAGARGKASWYCFSANKANGLRRTNAEKQRAVKAALAHRGPHFIVDPIPVKSQLATFPFDVSESPPIPGKIGPSGV